MTDLIDDAQPLQPRFQPESLGYTESKLEELEALLSRPNAASVLQGVHGSGKTVLSEKLLESSSAVNQAYVPCVEYDTRYKVLRRLLEEFEDDPGTGFHTAELQRRVENRVEAVKTAVVLDDVEFLLLNDGGKLLYTLSRLEADVRLLLTTSQTRDLRERLDGRTYSSLQPGTVVLEPPTGEQVYQVLAERARQSLEPKTLRREALTLIASTTQNLGLALTWLRTSVQQARGTVTERTVQQTRRKAETTYVEQKLEAFTPHHEALIQGVEQALKNSESTVTGEVLENYRELVDDPLTDRQLSTYLKHLEKLGLIESEYRYGGTTGKTREISWDSRCRLQETQ